MSAWQDQPTSTAIVSSPFQTGVHDYEIFNQQLDALAGWVVEAEEALRVHDPNGSTDLTLIQERMQELKVCADMFGMRRAHVRS